MRYALFALVLGCSSGDAPAAGADAQPEETSADVAAEAGPSARSFRLGFTPFPHDTTESAVEGTYGYLANDGDLYAFHTLPGVPWVEAGAGKGFAEYGKSVRDSWSFQKSRVKAGHGVYLGLTPLDDGRKQLADQWGDAEHMPLPSPWSTYAFDAAEVRAAYLKFCEEGIALFNPDYLAIGIEVNLLKKNAPEKWSAYVTLQKETYRALKAKHPKLPVFVTVTAVDILAGWTDAGDAAQAEALTDVMAFSDYLALSFYPYMSKYLTNDIPADTFDKLQALAKGKPIAIAESGYPAETFTLPTAKLTFEGTDGKQAAWIEKLLRVADEKRFAFVVNFAARDYDALWEKIGRDELALVWRDTGLYAGDGRERPSLGRWRTTLARPFAAPRD
jgi:hypothetical protein